MISNRRRSLIGFLMFQVICGSASRIAFAEDLPPLPAKIQRTLTWFPEDTETLIAAQSFVMPSMKKHEASATPEPFKPDFNFLMQVLVLQDLLGLEKGKFLEELAEKNVVLALYGARNYDLVSKFGSLRAEGCCIIEFDKNLDDAWLDKLKGRSKEVRRILDRDVFVSPSTTVMDGWAKQKSWQGTFIVALRPNTLLCATSDRFLETILSRVESKAAVRALPDHLPEWKHLDPNAPYWLMRHLPGEGTNIIGLTLTAKDEEFQVVYLPREKHEEKTMHQAPKLWNDFAKGTHLDFQQAADGTTVVRSNDIDRFVFPLVYLQGDAGGPGPSETPNETEDPE